MPTPEQPSASTLPPSRKMHLVGEKRLPDPPSPSLSQMISSGSTTTTATPPNIPAEYMHRAAWKAGVMGSLNVLAIVLGVRLTLLVAVGGASASGSVASRGWSAPQAANRSAKPGRDALSPALRVDFDRGAAMDQKPTCPDERQPDRTRKRRLSHAGGLTRRSARSYSPIWQVQTMDWWRQVRKLGLQL